jgi:hypothetical protein
VRAIQPLSIRPKRTKSTPSEQGSFGYDPHAALPPRVSYDAGGCSTWRGARAAESDSLLTPKGRFVI